MREAAFTVMAQAYVKASDNGELPANARQIMYAARPDILRITGRDGFDDTYFTQKLLPSGAAGQDRARFPAGLGYDPIPQADCRGVA